MTTKVPSSMTAWVTGTVTLGAAATTVAANTSATASSVVVLTPTNAAAATQCLRRVAVRPFAAMVTAASFHGCRID